MKLANKTTKMFHFEYSIYPITKDNEKIMNRQGKYFLSSKYKNYEKAIALETIKQWPPGFKRIASRVRIKRLLFKFSNKRHSDLANLLKSIFDALQGILYFNDKQIKSINNLELVENANKPGIVLELEVIQNG